eukprot:scaffold100667_cov18-Tisochrysis_lutea.AAC.4
MPAEGTEEKAGVEAWLIQGTVEPRVFPSVQVDFKQLRAHYVMHMAQGRQSLSVSVGMCVCVCEHCPPVYYIGQRLEGGEDILDAEERK